jgi:hypothetical protein
VKLRRAGTLLLPLGCGRILQPEKVEEGQLNDPFTPDTTTHNAGAQALPRVQTLPSPSQGVSGRSSLLWAPTASDPTIWCSVPEETDTSRLKLHACGGAVVKFVFALGSKGAVSRSRTDTDPEEPVPVLSS